MSDPVDLGHPLYFVVVFLLALIDGVFPLVPTRTAVIGLGVLAGAGDRRAYPLLALATAAAFLSDNFAYWLGAHHGGRISRLLLRGPRARRVWSWVAGEIRHHGLLLVSLARVIPGGPTPITLTAGLVGFPLGRFRVAAALGACLWSAYAFGVGMFGATLVSRNLLLALAVALAVAGAVNLAVTLGMRRRRAGGRSSGQVPPAQGRHREPDQDRAGRRADADRGQ